MKKLIFAAAVALLGCSLFVSNAVAKGFSDIFQYAFGGLDEDTARFVAAKAGKFGPQGIQTAVSVANQVSVNPNTRAVFNTVNLRAFSFTFKMIPNSAQEAQEIQKIAPELVTDNDGTLSVAYGNLTGYLIEAVKELKAEIEELKKHKCDCKK